GLTEVTIGNSVTSINDYAFCNCSELLEVTIGNSVTEIGENAFYKCSRLTEVTIPSSVTSIGYDAFEYCSGLTEVHISSLEAWCNIDFNFFYSNPLFYATNLYLNGELVTDLVIPETVTSIKKNAFYRWQGLTSVTIPNSVTSIGNDVFYGCSRLTEVHISSLEAWCNIDFFGDFSSNPLHKAHNLYLNGELVTDLVIPETVTSIKKNAFYGCSGLAEVTIPNSVTEIGENAFYSCTGLTKVKSLNPVPPVAGSAFDTSTQDNAQLFIPNGSLDAYKSADGWRDFK
ncbi:MAG: leucine-rich repeat domain-containing protein, partial [Paramuribaculum sp.]|nr:leucine-rich repeat domain-containing protein [Paramuribaculum sp.]